MLVGGIIFIIAGLAGYFYTLNEMNSLRHSIDAVGNYLGATNTPMVDILNRHLLLLQFLALFCWYSELLR